MPPARTRTRRPERRPADSAIGPAQRFFTLLATVLGVVSGVVAILPSVLFASSFRSGDPGVSRVAGDSGVRLLALVVVPGLLTVLWLALTAPLVRRSGRRRYTWTLALAGLATPLFLYWVVPEHTRQELWTFFG
ncbi:hypothetical protein KIH74_22205 [Kineosporia sp. J2-2]|uniref:Integral membrane protein n=1 Tax=Kineosporia corallincola TaxID=2835133 RepID=A0ABS5TPZ2_9ACTN|nr:hypothetical protein [Kineosporia corallincola]MBT0771669.1 hypothetical protein [Kineosporia corallincola]